MAMEITSNYNSVYESAYTTQKQQAAQKEETKGTTEVQKSYDAESRNNDYLSKLQKKVPSMILRVGKNTLTSEDKRVGTLTVHPDILAQMQDDPEKEKYYIQRMKDIARAEKLGRGITNSLGFTTVYSHWSIDKDGKIWHTAMTVRKDKLNEKLRKEAQENEKKQIEKSRENNRKKAEQLAEQLEEKAEEVKENNEKQEKAEKLISEKIGSAKDGKLVFNEADIQTLIEAAKKKRQGKADTKKQPVVGANLDLQV